MRWLSCADSRWLLQLSLSLSQASREAQRVAAANWLSRILSKVSGAALQQLQDTEERFGDAVSFKGHDYAPRILQGR